MRRLAHPTPRTLDDIAHELASRDHWASERSGLCEPCTGRGHSLAGVPFPCPGYFLDREVYMKAMCEAQDIGRNVKEKP